MDDLVKRLWDVDAPHVVNRPVWTIKVCAEAAARIDALERALRRHACDCETCERPPEDQDASCAANIALKGDSK
jgi:hypothetical protein